MTGGGASWARAVAAFALGICVLTAFPENGQALEANKYCSSGSDPTRTGDTVNGSLLSVADVILWNGSLNVASNCYGDFDPGNSSIANETAALNNIFGNMQGTGNFVYLDKTGDASNPQGLNGIQFQVHTFGGQDGSPGLWTIVWTDTGGVISEGLPLKIDLAVLLVGGNYSAAYLLSGMLVPGVPGGGIGIFDIQFFNGSAVQGAKCWSDNHYKSSSKSTKDSKHSGESEGHCDKYNQPSISHLLIAGRLVSTQEIPEPATMALFGAGLASLWAFSRRRAR